MRKTKIRTELLSLFDVEHKPLSAIEIQEKLKRIAPSIHKTTVYRELATLKENSLVSEVLFSDGIVRFEKMNPTCHHHLVCENCGEVEDITVNEKELFRSIPQRNRFSIKRHSIEFFGLCHQCH